ncbi:hypothetical protein evm_004400 [Chilo suppressalis]|nr:hypothetical protein evm_004400 [Chilo suppressalis]
MYRNKKDVDKHVENLISKLSVKEFKTRSYSVARLYYEVGDYASCQRYVEQYLTQKDNNAAAYKLLGQALHKLGQKEKALEQYRTSLDIDPTQTSTILDICELLVDDEILIDTGRAKYWCEKAEATFPRHPVTFRLREKLMSISNPNPGALVDLLTAELTIRPKDPQLHARLLKHYIHTNQITEAINHSCNVEFAEKTFRSNYAWYESLAELLKHNSHDFKDWLFQLLLLTVREHMCILSLTDTPGSSKSLIEANELLFLYDQDIENVSKAGATPGFGEFHANLLQHHRGQFLFHAATFLLKRAKKDQLNWHIATKFSAPLMLMAWHIGSNNTKVNWLFQAPEKQQLAARRWYLESVYRCSQAGHYLLSQSQDKSQSYIDQISQCCSGTHWRDKIYEKLFTSRPHLAKIKSSHFVTSGAYTTPTLKLPRKIEVEVLDDEALMEYPNSLHHFVWVLLCYKNFAHFKCSIFDAITPSATNTGPESMNKIDIEAFLYCSALTTKQQKPNAHYVCTDKPAVLPANITDLMCTISQLKWWDCAYKFSQNELGTELTDIRGTLCRGIEVVRCIDSHGLDPELLCVLGRIFSEKAKLTTETEYKNKYEQRAVLYYSSAIPLLEKLKSKVVIKLPEKRIFDYTHKELSAKELNSLIEESKLMVALSYINDSENEKAIGMLSGLKSPEAFYHLSQTYRKVAIDENNQGDKYVSLLLKARTTAYKAMDGWKHSETHKNNPLFSDTQDLIEELDSLINKIDPDLSGSVVNELDGKYSSDENVSLIGSDHTVMRSKFPPFRNISSTPKAPANANNITNYRTAIDSQILENTRLDQRYLERIETEIKNLQKRDTTINNFMQETKQWFEENRKLGNEIITTIHSNIQNTTDQFKLLKISVDQVKDQIDECRNECKDVGELKKQIAEMKKEINKLKKTSSEQNINESDLYNLEDDYRTSESTSTFTPQLPFVPPVMPPFNQRLVPPFPVPPNPYQLYNQNLYNLYNQYTQFGQSAQVPGAPPIFDPSRGQINYPGVYPTPEAMYLDVAQLVPPPLGGIPAAPTVSAPSAQVAPSLSTVTSIPTVSSVSMPPTITTVSSSKTVPKVEPKDIPRSLPINVVITSSDPLPTCTTTPAPILSVTIPSKHIKGSPHNYQIPMPITTDTKAIAPPVFSFPSSDSKMGLNNAGNISNNSWNQSSVFKIAATSNLTPVTHTTESFFSNSKSGDLLDNSKTVVDGVLNTSADLSLNKSRTLSERSNTSVEYDPCPDFKPIIPLPAEVKVTTGEEDETVIFSSRAKLFRFVDKQWKERGLGEMKLLKHNVTGKVRVLMRREQIHKICANHIITSNMEIKPMKNETKAYFWVANDFADETVVLEKFCIRFKTADIASQFYEKFEQARKECSSANVSIDRIEDDKQINTVDKLRDQQNTPAKNNSDLFSVINSNKPGFTVGGFTFSSTPTFKPVTEQPNPESKPTEPSVTKANIFSTLSFKPNTSSPFNNIFTTSSQSVNTAASEKKDATSTLNTSDTVEEFEPNVEFEPVIPLPALVDQKTGEEDEIVLFEHRAKLLRFDTNGKEWKERGLGNIKLLVHKDNFQKVRLLMRREQIMKVCCNHALSKEMTFQKMPNMDKAVTWCAKDFSDGELISETFCLRFKTVQTCDEFMEIVKSAQSKMKDDTKAAKEDNNLAKQNTHIGFGDKFKPKPGAWSCNMCYTNNLESFDKCACCEQPKPQTNSKPVISTNTSTSSIPTTTSNVITNSNWGEAFKPKPGTWECKECLIRNEATSDSCSACNTVRDSTAAVKSTPKVTSDEGFKFKFGMSVTNTQTPKEMAGTGTAGWGDKFKPKEGSWECQQCFVRNEADSKKCSACSNPKDPSDVSSDSKSIFGCIGTGQKFNFGIPANSAVATKSNQSQTNQNSSIFDGTGAHKFSFGIPSTTPNNATSVVAFGEQKSLPSNIIFATPKAPDNQSPLNFSLKINDQGDVNVTPKVAEQKDEQHKTQFGGTFDFVFKPKTPPKAKHSVKSPKSEKGDESDDNEYASEDEGHHIHFSPVIPLPDKVEVVTGEENETVLYCHRAKLFRFVSSEWKERGIGVVKILKHKDTGKLRVLMRREQVLKICLNHELTAEITYTPKDDKTWLFAANDFSDGELSLQHFCLRFKNKETATEFKEAVDNARGEKTKDIKSDTIKKQDNDQEDVVFVNEIQASTEDKQKAKELMLPENFFTYKMKENCQGCRGCDLDDNAKSSVTTTAVTSAITTPVKTSTSSFSSPLNSFYGTPANFDKTVDVSLFRTPLGSLGSNTKSTSPLSTNSNNAKDNDTTNKENSLSQKPNIFSNLVEQKTLFGSSQNKANNAPSVTDAQAPPSTKGTGILAPPKLSSTLAKPDDEKPSADPKSIFGAAQNNSLFGKNNSLFGNFSSGGSMNKSVFGFTAENTTGNSDKQEFKSIFGGDDKTSTNLFSGSSQGSLFGPGALTNNQAKPTGSIFGTSGITTLGNTNPSQVFGGGRSIFGNNNQTPTWTLNTNSDQKKPDVATQDSTVKKTDDPKVVTGDKKDVPFKVDNNLSFAALSSSGPGFDVQKKADFQWEGAGQQLFTAAQKEAADAQQNQSGAGSDAAAGADEEYDPHYEPIVPLPDKIVVTTGEEDEEKMFGERCKLYRYDEKTREWKERGVGEMKVLYHPERKTFRLLLRREQVHKAVLNMLVFMDLELLPMKNSDRAWTWAGRNYAESAAGEQETLAVRFKSVDLATGFRDKVVECVRKLQAAAAQVIREEKASTENAFSTVTPLRLPKHLQDSARADKAMSDKAEQHAQSPTLTQAFFNLKTETKPNGETTQSTEAPEVSRQVHFEEAAEDEEQEEDNGYDYNEDYDSYYNEEEEESAPYYSCDGAALIQQGSTTSTCDNANIQVLFDQEMYSPKILVTDADTGEILADMLIHTDTEFQMSGDSCTWSGQDYTSNEPVDKTVTLNFQDSDTTMQFYDSCETSKAATYSSTDQET